MNIPKSLCVYRFILGCLEHEDPPLLAGMSSGLLFYCEKEAHTLSVPWEQWMLTPWPLNVVIRGFKLVITMESCHRMQQ